MQVRIGITIILGAATLLLGCTGGKIYPPPSAPTGELVHHGRALIVEFKCGSCHVIPGIPGAHGVFGPPLNQMSRRTYIAGEFPNVPENLQHWIESPESMKPKTDMPDLGLSNKQAADVVAYLETLR